MIPRIYRSAGKRINILVFSVLIMNIISFNLVGKVPTFSYKYVPPWRRQWHPIPVLLPGESQGRGEPGWLQSVGSRRVGHN